MVNATVEPDAPERQGAGPRPASRRDARVDVLRGLALFMIFVDHMPHDTLNWWTLHNFGFADAAEVFVLLAGFSSMMAYGRAFQRDGVWRGLKRIGGRCLRIYLVHEALLLTTLVVVWTWTTHFHMQPLAVAPLLSAGFDGMQRALTLRALPDYLDILPLYIVLLGMFPLIYWLLRQSVALALLASATVWIMANLNYGLNLPNWIDGNGWYFNPFTWQLLFTIGAVLAMDLQKRPGGMLPRIWWVAALCWCYLGFAALQTFPYSDWGLRSMRPFMMDPPDKSHLSPLRIIDILALMYPILSSRRVAGWLGGRVARVLAICGKHSLEVFAIGCVMALLGRLVFRTFGSTFAMQALVNASGFIAMATVAAVLERGRARAARASLPPMQASRRAPVPYETHPTPLAGS